MSTAGISTRLYGWTEPFERESIQPARSMVESTRRSAELLRRLDSEP